MIIRHDSGAVVAEGDGVVAGANCVGYVTAQVPKAGNKTFAVTLTDCANPGADVRVDKLLASDNFYGYGKFDGADQIWRWDAMVNGWAKYFYEKKGRTTVYAWKKWNYAESKVEDLTNADELAAGEGFIFRRAGGAATLTFTWKALRDAE